MFIFKKHLINGKSLINDWSNFSFFKKKFMEKNKMIFIMGWKKTEGIFSFHPLLQISFWGSYYFLKTFLFLHIENRKDHSFVQFMSGRSMYWSIWLNFEVYRLYLLVCTHLKRYKIIKISLYQLFEHYWFDYQFNN